MDTHRRPPPTPPKRTRQNDMMLRLNDEERAALDRVAAARDATCSEAIRALILEADAKLERRAPRHTSRKEGA